MSSKIRLLQLILIFCTYNFFSVAQNFEPNKGKVVIFFEADTKVIVKLDSTIIEQTKQPLNIPEGRHVVTAWAPNKKLFVDTITVKENKMTICVSRLKPADEYVSYRKKLRSYKLRKSAAFVPFPLAAAFSGYAMYMVNKNKKLMTRYEQDAANAANEYNTSVALGRINLCKQQYEFSRSEYNKYLARNNRLRTAACIAVPAGLAASAVLFIMTKNLVKPTYSETPLLSFNTIGISQDYTSGYALTLILNINR